MGFFKNVGKGFKSVFKKPLSGLANVVRFIPGGQFIAPFLDSAAQQQATEDERNFSTGQMREQMAFSAQQASEQMGFQERMSSSAMQRSKQDMLAAGFNPLLALPGGASTPGGAAGSSGGADAGAVDLRSVVTSAFEARRMKEEFKNMREQRLNLQTDTQMKDAEWRNRELAGSGLKLENELSAMRNDFFKKNSWAFKLNAAAGGLNSASSLLRLLK